MKNLFFFLILLLSQQPVLAQCGNLWDLLIIDEDTSWVRINITERCWDYPPLEDNTCLSCLIQDISNEKSEKTDDLDRPIEYWGYDISVLDFVSTCDKTCKSEEFNGWVASFFIENDSLFLIRIQTNYCDDNPIDIDLEKELNSNRVFAYWIDAQMIINEGRQLEYVSEVLYTHPTYLMIDQAHEKERTFTIENGILTNSKVKNHVIQSEDRLYPYAPFLEDTIKSMIINSISSEKRSNLKVFRQKKSYQQCGHLLRLKIS